MESRGPDDPLVPGVSRDQGASRFERLSKELSKDGLFVAIPARMLFPDERVGRDRVQRIEILGAQRTERDELPFENRLKVEEHGGILAWGCSPAQPFPSGVEEKVRSETRRETATRSSDANSYRSPIVR